MYGIVLIGVCHSVISDQKNRWTTLTSLLVSRAGVGTLLRRARPKYFRLCGLCHYLSQLLNLALVTRKEPQMIQNNEHGCAPIKLHLWTLISYTFHKLHESLLPAPSPGHLKM